MVWQRNRYGQICYPLFIPFNPRTPAQCAVRNAFDAVSARWRTLTQPQRDVWNAVGRTRKSRCRLGCGPLSGFNYFVQVNVPLAHHGQPQFDLPPGYLQPPRPALPAAFDTQVPLAATRYLQANHLLQDSRAAPHAIAN
jgi:hypothetical protein